MGDENQPATYRAGWGSPTVLEGKPGHSSRPSRDTGLMAAGPLPSKGFARAKRKRHLRKVTEGTVLWVISIQN
jgi:hypothetical protein